MTNIRSKSVLAAEAPAQAGEMPAPALNYEATGLDNDYNPVKFNLENAWRTRSSRRHSQTAMQAFEARMQSGGR